MARKKSLNLTEAEQRLMEVLWEKGSATVAEVTDALPKKLGLAYNTVLRPLCEFSKTRAICGTPSRRTAAKFLYTPVVSREQASHSALRHLLSRFFGNSAEALVLNLLDDEKLSEAERKRIRNLLEEDTQ